MEIGSTFRRLRKEAGLTIGDLADTTGLSRAYISQVETSKASPSLQTVRAMCDALGVSPAILFEDTEAQCVFLPKKRQKVLHFESEKDEQVFSKTINVLSDQNRKLEVVILELSPGTTAGDHAHPGEEVFFILEGELTVTHGKKEFMMSVGDSIHIESQQLHKLYNHTDQNVRVISARTPPGFINLRHDETLKSLKN
ncbi:cupin domain-containing protein [Cognatishimia sp. SS12]|uniref:cupin domain-containing protein n=1 Tax=Cognatishimia sp. SS12 TaxID=2979465 RepID=UPI002330EE15|nr:cupin domain-containing protein [Cognatishimia sp. SS12]MDC0738061.1 cupin domain-containing protein [Cognatishimia sp. SS12]